MINLPVAPGVSGHLVGAALAAVLLGPWRAVIVMAVVLAVQALLFQDGGITALGANITDMGVAGSLAGYAGAALTARWAASPRGRVAGGVLGAFVATLAAAVLTARVARPVGPLSPAAHRATDARDARRHRPARSRAHRRGAGDGHSVAPGSHPRRRSRRPGRLRGRLCRRGVRHRARHRRVRVAVRVGAARRPRSRRRAPRVRGARARRVGGAVRRVRAAVLGLAGGRDGPGRHRRHARRRSHRMGGEPRRQVRRGHAVHE